MKSFLSLLLFAGSVFIFPAQAQAGVDQLNPDGAIHQELDEMLLESINRYRSINDLEPLELAEKSQDWADYQSCMSASNVERRNQGVYYGHNKTSRYDASPVCANPSDKYGHTEIFGLISSGSLLFMSSFWYGSPGHRASLLCDCDYVYVGFEHYASDGGPISMGLVNFGNSQGRATKFTGEHASDLHEDVFTFEDLADFPRLDYDLNLLPPRSEAPIPEPELTPERASVGRLYTAYFGRLPDSDGWNYWMRTYFRDELTIPEISEYFATSQEFQNTYGQTGDADFVELVYKNVMGRVSDEQGKKYWVGLMEEGLTRGSVMLYFSDSLEYVNLDTLG